MGKNARAMISRRRNKGLDVSLPLQLTFVKNRVPQYSFVSSSLLNLSEKEVYFPAMKKISKGRKVWMAFTLPVDNLDEYDISKLRVKIEGQVVRSEEGGFSVRFANTFRVSMA